MLELTPVGLYCPKGNFYIDPMYPVENALITHAHSDHAREGSRNYFAHHATMAIMNSRFSRWDEVYHPTDYEDYFQLGPVKCSFHPAGHVLGSAQIRLEYNGEVWVVSGDYKRDPDQTCKPYQPIKCDVFITETTFALPIFRWEKTEDVVIRIQEWIRQSHELDRIPILYAYSLGKTQRLLVELAKAGQENFVIHSSADKICRIYRDQGIPIPHYEIFSDRMAPLDITNKVLIFPPMMQRSKFVRRYKNLSEALVSGWMALRGTRRRRGVERGFVLSDHADWPSLCRTVRGSGAKKVFSTHGYTDVFARFVSESFKTEASELNVLRERSEEE